MVHTRPRGAASVAVRERVPSVAACSIWDARRLLDSEGRKWRSRAWKSSCARFSPTIQQSADARSNPQLTHHRDWELSIVRRYPRCSGCAARSSESEGAASAAHVRGAATLFVPVTPGGVLHRRTSSSVSGICRGHPAAGSGSRGVSIPRISDARAHRYSGTFRSFQWCNSALRAGGGVLYLLVTRGVHSPSKWSAKARHDCCGYAGREPCGPSDPCGAFASFVWSSPFTRHEPSNMTGTGHYRATPCTASSDWATVPPTARALCRLIGAEACGGGGRTRLDVSPRVLQAMALVPGNAGRGDAGCARRAAQWFDQGCAAPEAARACLVHLAALRGPARRSRGPVHDLSNLMRSRLDKTGESRAAAERARPYEGRDLREGMRGSLRLFEKPRAQRTVRMPAEHIVGIPITSLAAEWPRISAPTISKCCSLRTASDFEFTAEVAHERRVFCRSSSALFDDRRRAVRLVAA